MNSFSSILQNARAVGACTSGGDPFELRVLPAHRLPVLASPGGLPCYLAECVAIKPGDWRPLGHVRFSIAGPGVTGADAESGALVAARWVWEQRSAGEVWALSERPEVVRDLSSPVLVNNSPELWLDEVVDQRESWRGVRATVRRTGSPDGEVMFYAHVLSSSPEDACAACIAAALAFRS